MSALIDRTPTPGPAPSLLSHLHATIRMSDASCSQWDLRYMIISFKWILKPKTRKLCQFLSFQAILWTDWNRRHSFFLLQPLGLFLFRTVSTVQPAVMTWLAVLASVSALLGGVMGGLSVYIWITAEPASVSLCAAQHNRLERKCLQMSWRSTRGSPPRADADISPCSGPVSRPHGVCDGCASSL